jgi:hypothetical protein
MVCNNSNRVFYGPKHVEKARGMKQLRFETLLINTRMKKLRQGKNTT